MVIRTWYLVIQLVAPGGGLPAIPVPDRVIGPMSAHTCDRVRKLLGPLPQIVVANCWRIPGDPSAGKPDA